MMGGMGAGTAFYLLYLFILVFLIYLIIKMAVRHAIRGSADDLYRVIKEGVRDGMLQYDLEKRVKEAKINRMQESRSPRQALMVDEESMVEEEEKD